MKRLFFALWPNDETRQQCDQISRALRGSGKPVAAANLHVTLLFLGSVDESLQRRLTQAAAQLAVRPMSLSFDRLSFWRKPAVVCLSSSQSYPAVEDLVTQLTGLALPLGIPLDQRPYQPHVTLLRKAKTAPTLAFPAVEWRADGFCLVESCSTSRGVEYRVLERWSSA
jgi:2'-5' RNA ligase